MKAAPALRVWDSVEEWRLAGVGERTLLVRVGIRVVLDSRGRFGGAEVSPLAVVLEEPSGRFLIPIPDGEEGERGAEFAGDDQESADSLG
jgi:hypothetical protein